MKNPTPDHTLKCLQEYYKDVLSGNKNFEVRFNDRDYKVGQILLLQETTTIPYNTWDEIAYTGREIYREITYVLSDYPLALKAGFVVLGIKPIKHQK